MRGTCWVGFVPTFYFGFKTMLDSSIVERIDKIADKAARGIALAGEVDEELLEEMVLELGVKEL